jgi:PAS domain S-box-containing protein
MKKLDIILWYLPLCFFIFVARFIFVKFIFIFFFSTAFEPRFMFDLIPYYLLSGVNNLHLLLLALIVVGFDAYLHFRTSRKNLALSFIPTIIMLTGLGFKIGTSEMTLSNLLSYVIFCFLLIILLTDQRHILAFPEITTPYEKEKPAYKPAKYRPALSRSRPEIAVRSPIAQITARERPSGYVSAEELLTLNKETLLELRSIFKEDLSKIHDKLEKLEHRTRKVDILEEEIRKRRYTQPSREVNLNYPYTPSFEKRTHEDILPHKEELPVNIKKEKQTPKENPNIDTFEECAVILKRGVLKQANPSFVKLLGFEKEILLEKNLFNFIAPEGLFDIEKYYMDRLRGDIKKSCETVLLDSNNIKIHVEITITPTIYNGEAADIAIIRKK